MKDEMGDDIEVWPSRSVFCGKWRRKQGVDVLRAERRG